MEKSLALLLNQQPHNNDNFHLIAISNVKEHRNRFERWWGKKYRIPSKPYGDHTLEEILIEMLEDYYETNPAEADRMLSGIIDADEDWDGSMPEEYERRIQSKLKGFFNRNKVDLSKYRSDEQVDEVDILKNLGRNLPKSKKVTNLEDTKSEFDDDFGA